MEEQEPIGNQDVLRTMNHGIFLQEPARGDIIRDISGLNGVINDSGYIIESQGLTYVSFRFNSPLTAPNAAGNRYNYHSGAYVSKGASALGSRIRTATFTNSGSRCCWKWSTSAFYFNSSNPETTLKLLFQIFQQE